MSSLKIATQYPLPPWTKEEGSIEAFRRRMDCCSSTEWIYLGDLIVFFLDCLINEGYPFLPFPYFSVRLMQSDLLSF